jgi:hypothetical protein
MPARRRKQSNAMLYTLITFVGLFIVATTVAVIYYVKAEENRASLDDMRRQINDYASDRERQAIGSTVGTKQGAKSWLATMVGYLDQTVCMVVGGVPQPTSAEVKVKDANAKVAQALSQAKSDVAINDPNTVGLVPVIQQLTAKLDTTKKAQTAAQQQLSDLQQQFDDATKVALQTQQNLTAQKEQLVRDVNDIKKKYDELSALLKKTTDQQVQTLSQQLDQTKNDLKTTNEKLLKTQAELKLAQGMLQKAQQEVARIMPGPDRDVRAYQPDGRVILVDDQAKVVHLDIGSDKHVYPGLTFGVYSRGEAVPPNGKGKAEVEVFDVAKTYSAARIVNPNVQNPILPGDTVANLIWDCNRPNVFVVAGDFDLDNNGSIDPDGAAKIKALIEKWGGKVVDAVTIDTDYVLLGQPPKLLPRPTLEQTEIDPRAMQKYNASVASLNRYNELQSQAQTLWIPIFTYEKFLYFIGYEGQIGQPGAF